MHNSELEWIFKSANLPNDEIYQLAKKRQTELTKPLGALGQLEELAVQMAEMQGREDPQIDNIYIALFAADHGVAEENISAYPQEITVEMLRNFANGGAAINVLAKELNATLDVVDVGTVTEPEELNGVLSRRIANGTNNFVNGSAMSEQQLAEALAVGKEMVAIAKQQNADLFIGGEMGIGNTTSAAAVAAALLETAPELLVGAGTGLDDIGIQYKRQVVEKALSVHAETLNQPLNALQNLAGFEIVALTGAFIAAADEGIPVLVDGFIATVAALAAHHINPRVHRWFIFSHQSAEQGHKRVLDALDAKPILDLGMRLGEGSGAAVTVPIIKMACKLHNEMATFAQAELSQAK